MFSVRHRDPSGPLRVARGYGLNFLGCRLRQTETTSGAYNVSDHRSVCNTQRAILGRSYRLLLGGITLFRKSRAQKSRPTGWAQSKSRYRAVSVAAPGKACGAAKALAGRRFLVGEAPLLPVAGCDAASCDCRYRQHADRRAESRRAADIGMSTPFHTGRERRSGKDRRGPETTHPDDQSYFDYFAR